MTVGEIAGLMTAAAAIVAAVGSIVAALQSLRNGKKIQQVEVTVDGRMEELLRVTGESQHALGVKQEFDREK